MPRIVEWIALSLTLTLVAVAAPAQDPPLRHPFHGVELVDGRIPLLDVKDSPDGRRYAATEETGQLGDPDAPPVHRAGIVELEQRRLSPAERAAVASVKGLRSAPVVTTPAEPRPRISERLATALAAMRAGETKESDGARAGRLAVEIHLQRALEETLQQQLDRAIATGAVERRADLEPVRQALLAAKRERIAGAVGELASRIAALGGKVTYRCQLGRCLTALLTPAQVEAVAAREPEVAHLDLVGALGDADDPSADGPGDEQKAAVRGSQMDGLLLSKVYQTAQFWDFNWPDNDGTLYHYDGENGASTDVTFAILERGGFRNTHKSYREASDTATRIRGMFECNGSSCAAKNGWPASEQTFHATVTAGSLFGDLTDGQDPAIANPADRIARSAPAREAKGYLYKVAPTTASSRVAFDHLADRSPRPSIVSYSIPFVNGDPECLGEDSLSRDTDELLFENGILPFVAAGNSGGALGQCRVWSPGSAAGAFTVAGWGASSTHASVCTARDAWINPTSSWGWGTKKRSIIDLAGAYMQTKRPSNACDTCTGSYNGDATPSIAGAALDFIDMYKNELGDFIDDPGVLFTTLLLMGDWMGYPDKVGSLFRKEAGAGRARMRMLNGPGMDAPWYFNVGWTCVDDGQAVYVQLAGGAVAPSGFRRLNAAIWWYDRRLEDGTPIDDLDLALIRDRFGTYPGQVVVDSDSPTDDKERVFADLVDLHGQSLTLRIDGADVTADHAGCGSNSMKVYYAALIEDTRRNDADGPRWNRTTCEGVEPMCKYFFLCERGN